MNMNSNAKKILVIDDDDQLRELLITILGAENYIVYYASNGKDGIIIYDNESPDLVITDIIMPEKQGIEVIIHIRSGCGSKIPIIAMTGKPVGVGDVFLQYAGQLGANIILNKPFTKKEILCHVRTLLGEEGT